MRSATLSVTIHCGGNTVTICRMSNGNHVDAEIGLRPAISGKRTSLLYSISRSHGIKRWHK